LVDAEREGASTALATTRRGAWVLADQAVSSLTNFGLSVFVLRAAGPREFGAFTLALATYMVVLCIWRALGGDPQLVRHSYGRLAEGRDAARAATGFAVVLGLTAAGGVLLASLAIGGVVGSALVHLALVLPGLLVQDAWRYTFFAAQAPARALVNDLAWALFQILLTAWVLLAGAEGMTTFILAWGVSATLAAALGMWQAGVVPRCTQAWAWLRDHRDLGPRFVAEAGIALAVWQVGLVLIGAVAGLAVLGTVNAARVFLGPFNLLALGVVGFAIPEGTTVWRRSPERLPRAIGILGGGLALTALLCTAGLLLVPERVGTELLGQTWPPASAILLFVGLWVAAEAAGQGPRIGLMVLADAKGVLRARGLTAPLILLGGPIGAAFGGARGAAIGLALAHLAGARYWWHRFASSFRDRLPARLTELEARAPDESSGDKPNETCLAAADGEMSG
jgi:hypothetical protein